jgi:ABC-type iron transport system FetAB permease component
MGFVALAFMLIAEFGLVLSLRGMTIGQYFATRDPVSGAVYYAMLLLFALLPYLYARRGL